MKSLLVILLLCLRFSLIAQPPNVVYSSQVKTVQLYPAGDQLGFPIIRLNSGEIGRAHV